jgi:acetyl esterase/lipase
MFSLFRKPNFPHLSKLPRLICALIAISAAPALGQYRETKSETFPLWTNGAPGSQARRAEAEVAKDYWVGNIHNPSVTVFRPDPRHANGAAILVIPGGGHERLVWNGEGVAAAKALNRFGITVFALKYRLAREPGSTYSIERDAAGDVRRAIRWIRAHAAQYAIDPHRVGAMGFSAGGELVAMVADNPNPDDAMAAVSSRMPPSDPLDRESDRPDFQILIFPGPLGIPGKAVADAPPAFLAAGSLDECCAAPTVELYEQLRKAGVPAELHMYAGAGHAFNLDETGLVSVLHWPDRLADWLSDGGWLDSGSAREAKAGTAH